MKNKKNIVILSSVFAILAFFFSVIAFVTVKKRRDQKEWIAFLVEDEED